MELKSMNLPSHMPMSQVKTFDDALVSEYYDQMSPGALYTSAKGQSVGQTILGDTAEYAQIDAATEQAFADGRYSGCGCDSTPAKKKLSPEYKGMIVLIGVIAAFMVVSHIHLARLRSK